MPRPHVQSAEGGTDTQRPQTWPNPHPRAAPNRAPRAARDVEIGRWLNRRGFPAVEPVKDIDQPVPSHGHVVTVWYEVPDAVMASTRELGSLLRSLHLIARPRAPQIKLLEPYTHLDTHLRAAAPHLTKAESDFLTTHVSAPQVAYESLDFVGPHGLIHGDANRKNAVRGSDGRAVLLDLERFSIGPREWDLAVLAVYLRLGWYTAAEYDDSVDAYGWDVRERPGLPVLMATGRLCVPEPPAVHEAGSGKRRPGVRKPRAPGVTPSRQEGPKTRSVPVASSHSQYCMWSPISHSL